MFCANSKQCCCEPIDPQLTACGHDVHPIQLRGVMLGKQSHVAHLADAHAAVEKVLVGVADQKQ